MLAAMGLAAMLCACCAVLRDQANVQDPSISDAQKKGGSRHLFLERWGPKWLDLVGADRFRRRVVGADISLYSDDDDEAFLQGVGQLPSLRYLDISVHRPTAGMAAALGNMSQLQILRIDIAGYVDDPVFSQECVEAVGKLSRLEELHLAGIDAASLGCLAGLKNLKSLSLQIDWDVDENESDEDEMDEDEMDEDEQESNEGEQEADAIETNGGMQIDDEQVADETESGGGIPLLAYLPALPRLEAIDLRGGGMVGDQDLRRLAVLPRLKSLNLSGMHVTDAGLAELPPLESLEELAIGVDLATPARLPSLRALKRLKALHIVRYTAVTDAVVAELPNLESHQARYTAREGIPGDVSHLLIMLMFAGRTYDKSDRLTTLALDHGDRVYAFESELDGLRRALDALRQGIPGIVIDSDSKWFDQDRGKKPRDPLSAYGVF